MDKAYILIVHKQIWKGFISYYIMESNGHAMIRITQEDDYFELSDLFIEEELRGQGLGDYILDYAIDFCKRICKTGTIQIDTNDYSAPFCDEWYKRKGFVFDRMESQINPDEDDGLDLDRIYLMNYT